MLRLATDADFNGNALDGLRLREPALDIVSVHEVGLSDAPTRRFSNGLRRRAGN